MIGNIIVFRFKEKTEQKSINQFCKKFYGQNTSSHGGKYQYRRHGLLDNTPHIKLRDVILLSEDEVVLSKFMPI